jgi:hypothetical protein
MLFDAKHYRYEILSGFCYMENMMIGTHVKQREPHWKP